MAVANTDERYQEEYEPLASWRYVCSQSFNGERLLVVCSFSEYPQRFKLPKGFDLSAGDLLFCNYECVSKKLRAYETIEYLF